MKHTLTLPLVAMLFTSCDLANSIKHSIKSKPKDLDKTFLGYYMQAGVQSIDDHKPTLADSSAKGYVIAITKGSEPDTYNVTEFTGIFTYTVANDSTLVRKMDIYGDIKINVNERTGLLQNDWNAETGRGSRYFKLK